MNVQSLPKLSPVYLCTALNKFKFHHNIYTLQHQKLKQAPIFCLERETVYCRWFLRMYTLQGEMYLTIKGHNVPVKLVIIFSLPGENV